MTPTDFPYGFRINGDCHDKRRLVFANAAFVGHCELDSRVDPTLECYLSVFNYAEDFRKYLSKARTSRGFAGPTWSPYVWFDIDRDGDLETARLDCLKLIAVILERYAINSDDLLIFFSGKKGYQVGLPTCLWLPKPGIEFPMQCRKFAEAIAAEANVLIDSAVYIRVQPLRAPNSRHPKTGCYKRFIGFEGLLRLSSARIVELAATPFGFELPESPNPCSNAIADWDRAVSVVQDDLLTAKERRQNGEGRTLLNRMSLDFIRNGPTHKDRRAVDLFSVAANLGEFGCPSKLAWALLSEVSLDSGLAPSEVRRQIECGLEHGRAKQ